MTDNKRQRNVVMVVDDEEPMRRLLAAMLASEETPVAQAADGTEALEMFLEIRDSVKAVITDLLMPKMDGHHLVKALRAIDQALPIVVISGHSDEPIREGPHLKFLHKPFGRDALLEKLKEAIGAGQ